jgi:uncharacterized membrane protein YccC
VRDGRLLGDFRRLRRLGLQAQAFKAALAAGLAWYVGAYVPWGPAQPYLAPLTAILTVQATVAESLQGAMQRVLGVAVGVGIAALASHTIGISPLTIVLLVLASQTIGWLLGLTIVGTSQVVISALLVLTVGEATANGWLYGWGRVAETVVGAGVGILVNGLVIPPSFLRDAGEAYQALATELHRQIDGLATELARGISPERAQGALTRARALSTRIEAARASLGQAEQSLRFNYFAGTQRRQLERFGPAVDVLEHVAIQLRGIARVLSDLPTSSGASAPHPAWLAPNALGRPLAVLLGAAGSALDVCSHAVTGEGMADGGGESWRSSAAAARQDVLAHARTLMPAIEPNELIALGAILADLDRMVGDLSRVLPPHADASTPEA